MTPSTPRYDAEEARKELLATIHASRDLSPEMDDALADRFMEKLGKLRPAGSFDPATTRANLQSLLNSSRGSDPVGDSAAADSFLAGLQAPRSSVPAYAPYVGYPANPNGVEFGPMVRFRGGPQLSPMIIGIAVYVVLLIVSRGELWWLFWIMPAIGGWFRRGNYQRRFERDQRRAYRHNRIVDPNDVFRPLPPSGPPEVL